MSHSHVDAKKLLEEIKTLSEKNIVVSAVLNLIELEIKADYLYSGDHLPTDRYVEDVITKSEIYRMALLMISFLSSKNEELNFQLSEQSHYLESVLNNLKDLKYRMERLEK